MIIKKKKTAIIIPYFNSPEKPIIVGDVVFDKTFLVGIDERYQVDRNAISMIGNSLFDIIEELNGKSKQEERMIIEKSNNIPGVSYMALIDLLINRWMDVLHPFKKENKGGEIIYVAEREKKYSIDSSFIKLFKKSQELLKMERFRISLMRWGSSYNRADALDSLLDCCSSLESLLIPGEELRLKLSLFVYHVLKIDREKSMQLVFDLYKKRNDFIHGNKIPEVTREEQSGFISVTASVLKAVIDDGMVPDSKKLLDNILMR